MITDINGITTKVVRALRNNKGCRLDRQELAILNKTGVIEGMMILSAKALRKCGSETIKSGTIGSTENQKVANITSTGMIHNPNAQSEKALARATFSRPRK